jgi:hypothetical protein
VRINRVLLRDFRGIGEVEIVFAPTGVTIVQGPNEVGKSSVAEALDMLIRHPDSSKRDDVRATQPVGQDVGPYVEADITSGGTRFRYAKRWLRQPKTELHVLEPTDAQLTGREAHDRAEEILRESTDLDLFRALWLRQDDGLGQAALGGNRTLGDALDAAASGVAVTADAGGDLMSAAAEARGAWYTDTGREKQVLTDLRDALAAADAALIECERQLEALGGAIEEIAHAEREIVASVAAEPDRRNAVAQLAAEVQAASTRAAHARELGSTAAAAEATALQAEAAAARRAEAVAALATDEAEAATLAASTATADEAAAEITARRDVAADAHAASVTALAAAQQAFDIADGDDAHLRDVFDRRQLVDRRERVDAASALIAAAEAFLDACTVDGPLMARIEGANEERAAARARFDAGAVQLRVQAESSIRVEWDDGAADLEAGAHAELGVAPGATARISGVARLSVDGGVSTGAAADALRRAEDALDALLAQAGVSGDADPVAAARALLLRRGTEEAQLRTQRSVRTSALDDLDRSEMDAKITRADTRIAAYTAQRADVPPMPDTREASKAARSAAERVLGDARATEAETRAGAERAAAAVTEAEKDAHGRESRLGVIRERIAAAQATLEQERAVHPDAALATAASDARAAAGAAALAADTAQAAAADVAPAELQARLDNAQAALARMLEERTTNKIRVAELGATIQISGDRGLADQVENAAAAREVCQASLHAAEAQAMAANHLYEVLRGHRDAAQRAYVAPYRTEVERLARSVFGPGTSVEIGHEHLDIASRTRNGRTVRFQDLSGGAREQLGIIGRLAAAGIAARADDGRPGVPVIIDDALGFSDSSRLEGLGAALVSAGERTQVIVLTCVPERYAGVGSATVVRMQPRASTAAADE